MKNFDDPSNLAIPAGGISTVGPIPDNYGTRPLGGTIDSSLNGASPDQNQDMIDALYQRADETRERLEKAGDTYEEFREQMYRTLLSIQPDLPMPASQPAMDALIKDSQRVLKLHAPLEIQIGKVVENLKGSGGIDDGTLGLISTLMDALEPQIQQVEAMCTDCRDALARLVQVAEDNRNQLQASAGASGGSGPAAGGNAPGGTPGGPGGTPPGGGNPGGPPGGPPPPGAPPGAPNVPPSDPERALVSEIQRLKAILANYDRIYASPYVQVMGSNPDPIYRRQKIAEIKKEVEAERDRVAPENVPALELEISAEEALIKRIEDRKKDASSSGVANRVKQLNKALIRGVHKVTIDRDLEKLETSVKAKKRQLAAFKDWDGVYKDVKLAEDFEHARPGGIESLREEIDEKSRELERLRQSKNSGSGNNP